MVAGRAEREGGLRLVIANGGQFNMMKIGRNYGRPRQYIIWVTKFIQGSTASDSGGTVNAQGL